MSKHLHKYRRLGIAGAVALAIAGISAVPAGAARACPPGTSNPAYCTSVPVTTRGRTTTVTLPAGTKSLVIPVTIGGVKGGKITYKNGRVTVTVPKRTPPGTYIFKIKIGKRTITKVVVVHKPRRR